jgi:ParB-like nuclease domain
MEPFYLVVDPDSLELSRGSITGKIHISNATCTFPEPEWNDFVVVVLGWWLEAAAEVSGRQGTEGLLRFMDRLKKAMQRDGFDPSEPIDIAQIDGRNIIIDGHHRARAAGAAKIAEVPVRLHVVDAATAAT